MAYQEHDDPAYAADIEGPPPSASSSPTAASFRRQRSIRTRELGLYANRLRQHQPPTKRDDAASDVEPLGFVEGVHAANGSPQSTRIHTRDDGSSSSNKSARRALLGGSPGAATHKKKFDFDDSFDEALDDDDGGDIDNERARGSRSPPFSPILHSPVSPVSPRWASLAKSTAVYSYSSSSSTAAASVPISSVHTSVASVAASTAPTSPISPTPSSFAGNPKSLFRTPSSSSASAARFAGLSSHPFVVGNLAQERTSSSTEGSSLLVDKREEPYSPTFSSVPPPPPPPSSDLRTRTPPPGSPGTMLVGNFSRPRQPSIKQGPRDAVPATATRLRQLEPIQLESPAPVASSSTQPAWPRERARGLSISSSKSSSTYSSLTQPPSNDHLRPNRLASTQDANVTSPRLPRPPLAYSGIDSIGSNTAGTANTTGGASMLSAHGLPQPRDPLLARADEESRSSYRSQWTASTAHRTVFTDPGTERSSVLTKTSSRTSMSWFTNGAGADESLSVDDVMGMYEKGFGDSTGAEDNDGPHGGATARDSADEDFTDGEAHGGNLTPSGQRQETLGSDLIGSQILEAMSDPLPIPSRASQNGSAANDTALEPPRPVRYSGLSSSVPNDSGLGLVTQHMNNRQLSVPKSDELEDVKEKRDSAKMLESDDKPSGRPSPLASPQLNTSFDSRPGSAKAPSLFARAQNESDDPAARDRYGFRKHNQYITREQYDAWNGPYTEYIGRRRRKWVAYLRDSGLITDKPTRFPTPSVKTKRFIRKGIPPEWRGAAWFYYAGGPSIVAKHPGIYDQLIARAARGEAKEVDIESIERDLHRTFPDNIAFQFSGDQQPGHGDGDQSHEGTAKNKTDLTADRPDEPKIVSKLRRVLLAFSIYNPRIGYCQSLNFLAGLLLLFVETEEHCFWLLNVITRIFLPGTHEMSLEGSKVDLGVLMAAIQESLPSVWAKIGGELEDSAPSAHNQANRDAPKHGTIGRRMKLPRVGGNRAADAHAAAAADRLPPITLCMTAWFMSCFIGTLPMETTLRVWDIFFYEGSKTLFRVALAIFKLGESEIRAVADPMEMFGVVQGLPRRLLDCNMLMETTFRRRNGFGHLSQESIEEKRRERRDAFKEARDEAAAAATGSSSATAPSSHEAPDSTGPKDATAGGAPVLRKGTLFGRRRERRPAEVM